MRAIATTATIGVLTAIGGAAAAETVRGTVFADSDRDGVFDRTERGVSTVVSWEGAIYVETNARGEFSFEVPGAGIVWARVPDGYRPGPVWQRLPASGADIDLALRPVDRADDRVVRFVVAADTHLHWQQHNFGDAELRAALTQATAGTPAPDFFTILGDVTQSNQPGELDQIAAAVADLEVPWVPVAGNHDWYDGGVAWRERFGPEAYSFIVGDTHFVVANTTAEMTDLAAFLERDLAGVDPRRTIVLMAHAPQPRPVIDVMERLGVDLFLAGHWHANRVVDHGELIELDTEPFLMGGMDFTPAGYRIITIADGEFEVEHRTIVRAPLLRLAAPHPDRCARPGDPLIALAAGDARVRTVTARIRDHVISLSPAGEWSHTGRVPPLPSGRHTVHLTARAPVSDPRATAAGEILICPESQRLSPIAGSWPQLGGGPARRGFTSDTIRPPVVERWATTVGGPVVGVVVGTQAVFATVTDLAAGTRGELIALARDDGRTLWRVPTGASVRSPPVLVEREDLVVIVRSDAIVVAHDATSGTERWRRDLGADLDPIVRTTFAAAAAEGDRVWAGGQRRFAALTAATGDLLWSVDPVPDATSHTTLAPPTVVDGLTIATFERSRAGVVAFRADGTVAWRVPGAAAVATNAAIAADRGVAYLANGAGDALAIDLRDGAILWSRVLTDDRHEWAYATLAAPAVGSDTVIIATMHGDLWALDRATGDARWRWRPAESLVYPTHYRGTAAAIAASPIITGDVVWTAAMDGTLTALDLATGTPTQSIDVAAPVISGLAAAGGQLYVGGWDGTVRAFASDAGSRRRLPTRSRWPELLAFAAVLTFTARTIARSRHGA